MRLLRVVFLVFWAEYAFSYSFSDEEKGVVESLIVQLKPHHVLFATGLEAYRSIQMKFLFVLTQWIDEDELENRGRGRLFVDSSTVVIIQSDIAQNYLNDYYAVCCKKMELF